MFQLHRLSGLTEFAFVKISKVVGIDLLIVSESFAAQAVGLITKYPASFSHSMASQSSVGVTGDVVIREETEVGTVVSVIDVNTVSEAKSSFSLLK